MSSVAQRNYITVVCTLHSIITLH